MTRPRIAACQFEPTVGDIDANLNRIAQLTADLPAAVEFAVFPELCITGYDVDHVQSTKTAVPGPVTDRVCTIARETDIDLIVGLPEAASGDIYNSLVYVSSDGVKATYRKQRLWGTEADHFRAGSGPTTVETPIGRVGLLLCYDLNFPELALAYSEADCDIIAVSAAWRQSFARDWRLLCRARALDQTCYVVGSNHCGSQSGRQHAGASLIAGPRGDILAQTTDGIPMASAEVLSDALSTAREQNPVRLSRRSG
ncbi:carbon-nitrogen hydrolase family protein [Natronorubrum aibiense]|uniref:Carbon-nitrogen hydrolase family protein n=1 Tax=Natronorubrum aibiense TaxID=348826 RepID=A0A5P9P2H5_9EURY|nr:carbon-nitrogen hydrolase family protein [Natronorubrum aibiense]QFU82324.1 carbon-nitrogen hydrolase family protein [Natronorubrum aibiense]